MQWSYVSGFILVPNLGLNAKQVALNSDEHVKKNQSMQTNKEIKNKWSTKAKVIIQSYNHAHLIVWYMF